MWMIVGFENLNCLLFRNESSIKVEPIFKSILMQVSEISYQRPNIEVIQKNIESLCTKFEKADSAKTQLEVVKQINDLRLEFETASGIVGLRYDLNTLDEFYEQEMAFLNSIWPQFMASLRPYYQLLLQSRFKAELQQDLGKHLFHLAQYLVESVNEKTVSVDQKINELEVQYGKIQSQAMLTFRNAQYPLSAIMPFFEDKDRSVRKEAHDIFNAFLESKQNEYSSIFDKMVQLRHQKAQMLGFENYIDFAYQPNDYNRKQISTFNKLVQKYFLPIRTRLHKRKIKRLGFEEYKYYDTIQFKNGSPKLQVIDKELFSTTQQMYTELSPETDVFFQFMQENELLDVEIREGKYPGAYHRPIPKYGLPFILANFNGTNQDFHTLTHELGHAFQYYQTQKSGIKQFEYQFPLADIAEIHSIGMELFTWKWYPLFFKEDTKKYQFGKISQLLGVIVSCCKGEDFQQFIYQNPTASTDQRNQKWIELGQQYYPYIDQNTCYYGSSYLKSGQDWHENMHIFLYPFYMVDYSLAALCAMQFWMRLDKDWDGAWQDYLRLCNAGGTGSFFELLDLANLRSPFDENVIREIAEFLNDWLEKVDDSGF